MSALQPLLLALEDRLVAGDYEALLHPDFLEFGQSGRRWTKCAVMAELPPASNPATREACETRQLSPDLALLTWQSQRSDGSAAWRSSLWERDPLHGWRLRFHQATRLPCP